MRRFLQSSSRNLPPILTNTNGTSRHSRLVSGLINETNRRPISLGHSRCVVLQARKTTNLFEGNQLPGSSGRKSSKQNDGRDANNNHHDDDDDDDKPKRGGSRLRSPGRQQASPADEQEHETTGQKLAKKFGWQTKTTKKTAASSSSGPSQAKKSNQDHQTSSSANNMKKDDQQQQQRRQTRSSSSSSSMSMSTSTSGSSRPSNERRDNPNRDHRANGSVRHDKQNQRFVLDLGNNQIARIDYRPLGGQTNKFNLSGGGRHATDQRQQHDDAHQQRAGDNIVELYHTEVPAKLRGQGIGRQLARGALECASGANMKLKVTCDYLLDYVHRFATPEQRRSLIVDDKRK